jgi:hypothetical protein
MTVVFYLKGSVRIDWRVPQPENFNFQIMVKMIRADGQFLAEGIYIQASEIAAILLSYGDAEDADDLANVGVRHRGGKKIERLVS